MNYEDGNNERGWRIHHWLLVVQYLPTLISPNSWPGGDGWGRKALTVGDSCLLELETYDYVRMTMTSVVMLPLWDCRGVEIIPKRYQDTGFG